MQRAELQSYLDAALRVRQFKDYCPNGLQVEGREGIERVLAATTANLELCQKAAAQGYDAILCHHGFFWRNEPPTLCGPRQRRVKALLDADVNLFAYHLPLDVHESWGNNVALAGHLGWEVERFTEAGGIDGLLCLGRPSGAEGASADALIAGISKGLGRAALAVGWEGQRDRPVESMAWCTGAAQDFLSRAIDLGVDAYISGEISLATTDLAREAGILYIAAGHHATERYGVQRLANHLAERFSIQIDYCEQDNPV